MASSLYYLLYLFVTYLNTDTLHSVHSRSRFENVIALTNEIEATLIIIPLVADTDRPHCNPVTRSGMGYLPTMTDEKIV